MPVWLAPGFLLTVIWVLASALLFVYVALYGTDEITDMKKKNKNGNSSGKRFYADMTLDQLAKYNGKIEKKVFIALLGKIYDVTDVPMFNSDAICAPVRGRDATLAMAMLDIDRVCLNQKAYLKLSEKELNNINQTLSFVQREYKDSVYCVGNLID